MDDELPEYTPRVIKHSDERRAQQREWQRQWMADPEVKAKRQEYMRKFRATRAAKKSKKLQDRAYALTDHGAASVKRLNRDKKFRARGISREEYAAMFEVQCDVCAICRKPETSANRHGTLHSLAIDHCHTNGHVRGLLCTRCNQGIGHGKDRPSAMRLSAEYLRRSAVAQQARPVEVLLAATKQKLAAERRKGDTAREIAEAREANIARQARARQQVAEQRAAAQQRAAAMWEEAEQQKQADRRAAAESKWRPLIDNGDGMLTIELTQGQVARVRAKHRALVEGGSWCAALNNRTNTYYAMRHEASSDGKRAAVYMHRLILGVTASSVLVEHRNGNTLDNDDDNLRTTTNQLRQAAQKLQGGSSQYRGVSWNKREAKWKSRIKVMGKLLHLGYFTDEAAAARAYDKAALAHFGEFAYQNFPQDSSDDKAA